MANQQGIDTRMPNKAYDSDTENRLLPPDHYRYGKNGRSGTSDKDGVGSVEGIRGNTLVAVGAEFEKEIGSCSDTKNNAVIRFIQNSHAPVVLSPVAGSVVSLDPLRIEVTNFELTIALGTFLLVELSGGDTFYAQVIDVVALDNSYTLKFLSGDTPIVDDLDALTAYYFNYIKRYYVNTGDDEFLTNPVLMSDVLGWEASSRIYNARVIEAGFTQLLQWTDPILRLMDVDKMMEN